MQVQFLNAPDFTINASGRLERSGCWLLSSADTGEDVSTLAEEWAGSINDFWRIPDNEGRNYTLDRRLKVKSIECKALDKCHCHVKFTAEVSHNSDTADGSGLNAIAGSFCFERKNDLTEYKTICYKLTGNDLELLPQAGDTISWSDGDYRCESLTCRENTSSELIAEIKAVNTAIELSGNIQSEQRHDEEYKIGSWLITTDKLDDFLQENKLHAPATWAGENFYIYQISTVPADSAKRTLVTLIARLSKLEMLETLCSEEIVSMESGSIDRSTVWQSRWRAKADDRDFFTNLLGSSAQEWTLDSTAVVCKVTPKRISDCEYEYSLEARRPEDIDRQHKFDRKDLDLPNHLEYYLRIAEMRFSAGQCGYTWRYNGTYRLISNWQANQLCPLVTAAALPQHWINQPIKLLEILEVSFLAGTSASNISQISTWFTGQRVSHSTIANINGCFLRWDLDVDDVTDSYGRDWTRITRIYRQAPGGYDWNSNYWI